MLRSRSQAPFIPETLLQKCLNTAAACAVAALVIASAAAARAAEPPVILGQIEYCVACHTNSVGLGVYHDPAAIGCAACHGGDPGAPTAKRAHAGMRLIPGQAQDAAVSCGQSGCHSDAPAKMNASLMSTMAGVVAIDRRAFGDATTAPAHVRALGHTPADDHLRTLCASCHLGNVKEAWGPVSQASRGGGCNACHLNYSPESTRALRAYTSSRGTGTLPPAAHPALSLDVSDDHCFGCHSRSGRISLSYLGLAEVLTAPRGAKLRRLADGRRVARMPADVHAARMQCIDCHTQGEVMGDGRAHAAKEEALDVACTDCHTRAPRSAEFAALTPEEQRVLIVRGRSTDVRFVQTRNTGAALTGAELTPEGVVVHAKIRNESMRARPPTDACEEGAHARLACEACHSTWAPQCFSCHTRAAPEEEGYDLLENKPKRGDWIETPGDYRAAPPVLGVRTRSTTGREEITTFVPGMILELNQGMKRITRHRYYSPLAPHTIGKARDCASCHRSPEALGYGSGKLRLRQQRGKGRWTFTPATRRLRDGLPADAWIGFLSAATAPSLRPSTRPFNLGEQKRILRVGACLACHAPESTIMQQYVRDPAARREIVRPACTAPSDEE